MEALWGFRFGRRTGWTAPDRDFAPLFNFVGQPVDDAKSVHDQPALKPGVTERTRNFPKTPPSLGSNPGQTRSASTTRDVTRKSTPPTKPAAAAPVKAIGDRVRAWIDLEELAGGIVRRDGRVPTASDAADWLLRLNFVFDGEAWSCDREDLRLIGNFGVLKVRRDV